jgi:outer membrane protein
MIGKGEQPRMNVRLLAKAWALFLIFMMMIVASGVLAADVQEITLDQAVEMALKNDSQVFNALNNVEKAKLAVKQEVVKTWPQATVTDSVFRDLGSSRSITGFPNTFTVTITETVPTGVHLYGKKIPTSIEVAIWEQINNEAQLQITEANTIYNTVSLYFNVLKAGEAVILQESIVKSNQNSLAIAREQLKQNKITKPEELKVENDLANAVYTLEKNRSDYNLALRQLGNQIGVKDISQLKLAAPIQTIASEIPDLSQMKLKAINQRLEMKQAQIAVQKAEQQLAQAQNQALPDLYFGYSYRSDDRAKSMSINYSFLSGNISSDVQGTFGDKNYFDPGTGLPNLNALTLKLTWNLDFGTPKNQIQQNQLLLANAKSSGVQTQQGIEWDVEQAAAGYQLALKKVEISRQAIPYYQKQLEIKRLQLKLGMASPLDMANAENDLLQAQNQAKSDEYDRLLAYKKLQMVTGELYPFAAPARSAESQKVN